MILDLVDIYGISLTYRFRRDNLSKEYDATSSRGDTWVAQLSERGKVNDLSYRDLPRPPGILSPQRRHRILYNFKTYSPNQQPYHRDRCTISSKIYNVKKITVTFSIFPQHLIFHLSARNRQTLACRVCYALKSTFVRAYTFGGRRAKSYSFDRLLTKVKAKD